MKTNSVKISRTLSVLLFVLLISTSCNSSGNKNTATLTTTSSEESDKKEDICKKMKWIDISNAIKSKDNLKSSMMIGDMNIYKCDLSKDELLNVIESYNLAENIVIKRDLISIIRGNTSSFDKADLDNFLLKVSRNDDPLLASQVIEALSSERYGQELIEIYKKRDNSIVRQAIILKFNNNIKELSNDVNLISLYNSAVASGDIELAPLAFQALLSIEGDTRSIKWQDWGWSKNILQIFERAVNKDFYILNRLSSYELIAISNKYPNSLFTKGCKEYLSGIGHIGQYFGSSRYNVNSSEDKNIFKQPFLMEREKDVWTTYIRKYNTHPSVDNAYYRLARSYEMAGDYDNALITYYTSQKFGDGDMSEFSGPRMLFIMDLVMSEDSLRSFLRNHPDHPLIPYVSYTLAVNMVRSEKFEEAVVEMRNFIAKYRNELLPSLGDRIRSSDRRYLNSHFWNNLEEQIQSVERIIPVARDYSSDKALYQKANFYFDNYLMPYNYLWRGGLQHEFGNFMPSSWDEKSSTHFAMSSDLIKTINQSWKSQSGRTISAKLFNELLERHPKSSLIEKSSYMIAVSHYRLAVMSATPELVLEQVSGNAHDKAIEKFQDFLRKFPNSSMADDALFSIADLIRESPLKYISTGDRDIDNDRSKQAQIRKLNQANEFLEIIFKDYPKGDRVKEARDAESKIRENLDALKR